MTGLMTDVVGLVRVVMGTVDVDRLKACRYTLVTQLLFQRRKRTGWVVVGRQRQV